MYWCCYKTNCLDLKGYVSESGDSIFFQERFFGKTEKGTVTYRVENCCAVFCATITNHPKVSFEYYKVM